MVIVEDGARWVLEDVSIQARDIIVGQGSPCPVLPEITFAC